MQCDVNVLYDNYFGNVVFDDIIVISGFTAGLLQKPFYDKNAPKYGQRF